MKNFARTLALLYAAIVGLAATWAWYADVTLLHPAREHMLPDILLATVSAPTSLTLGPLYELSPTFFSLPFMQLIWMTVCGVFQASVFYFLLTHSPRRLAPPNHLSKRRNS